MTFLIILVVLLFILLVIGISFYYYKLIKRFGSIFNKDINKKFILLGIIFALLSLNLFSIVGLFLIHFVFTSLFIDLIYLLLKKFINNKIMINIYKLSIVPLLISILIMGYGYLNIRNIIEVKYQVYSDEVSEDLRILFISDSHYNEVLGKDGLSALKKRLDAVSPDLVILGGDIVDEDTSKEEMEYVFSVFGSIKSRYGTYFVYGNHDRQVYTVNQDYTEEDIEKTLLGNDIKVLKDSYVNINGEIILIGREDYSFKRKSIDDILDKDMSNKYLIMVDHQPVKYDENVKNSIDLIMSGHTHGGQIFPTELFIKLFKTADLSYGYKNVEGMDAIVSSGLVGWGYPIRTSRHSEYVIIDVKHK
ncbi:MAG: metallophosphoesterase [Bacilli bacterium]|nr:metallophosphoesterase [Bacilli bacterium]